MALNTVIFTKYINKFVKWCLYYKEKENINKNVHTVLFTILTYDVSFTHLEDAVFALEVIRQLEVDNEVTHLVRDVVLCGIRTSQLQNVPAEMIVIKIACHLFPSSWFK